MKKSILPKKSYDLYIYIWYISYDIETDINGSNDTFQYSQ